MKKPATIEDLHQSRQYVDVVLAMTASAVVLVCVTAFLCSGFAGDLFGALPW